MTKLITHHGGWIPSKPDERDRIFRPEIEDLWTLPGKVDLREKPWNGPVLNQGQLGTCVTHAIGDNFRDVLGIEGHAQFLPSRLYIYAKGRDMEGSPLSQDTGMEVRDGLKVLAAGVPTDDQYPYSDANPGPFQQEPPANIVAEATNHAVQYSALQVGTGPVLRACLAAGYPFSFGFQVPDFFEAPEMASGQQTFLKLPPLNTNFVGGHAIKCMGYDFTLQTFPAPAFLIKNSWGSGWCEGGYFWMDYRYFGRAGVPALASDIWTIRLTS